MKRHLTAPPDARAALFFLPGQYLFKRAEGGREITKPLQSEQLARAFRDYSADTGWIQRRLLRYRDEPRGCSFVSVVPARIHAIALVDRSGVTTVLDVPLPSLILFGRGREYYLFASKNEPVTEQTKLCAAPLPNVGNDGNGRICFGANEIGEAGTENVDAVWNLIWQTPFSGDHSTGKCRSEPEDVRNLLTSLAARGSRKFPTRELVETGATVDDVWRRLVDDK